MGGGFRPDCQKTALTKLFSSPQRILQLYSGLSMFFFGSNFSRGGGGGVQMLISIETHRICEFGEPVLMPEPSVELSEQNLALRIQM